MEIFIYEHEQNLLSPPDLTAEIERLQEELLIEREQNLRALADFRNYRRHIEHDISMLVEVSNLGMMRPLLNMIDEMRKRYRV
jgi:molecular chaperone GrpE (heat shock protein)